MSKRKKAEPNPEEEEEDDQDSREKTRQQGPQKVYDFHKKTIEIYPQRLHELNQQFLSSISSQIQTEPYSVLVGNCLDYVRQYFTYEDDFLQYSPWLATRLKQSRSDIVKCLQETIDVYEALARHDFDRIVEKTNSQSSSTDDATLNGNEKSTSSSFPVRPPTTNSSFPPFTFSRPTITTTTTASSDATPSTALTSTKTTTANSDAAPSTGFSFKMPLATAAAAVSPEKTTNPAPFAFSIPNAGFGTSTFTPSTFGNPASTEKSSTSSPSSMLFATPPKFSFTPTPSASGEQPGTTEDNDDETNEPPEPEKVEHEADAKLTYRCRMGVKKGEKLIKRGPVQVILKEANEKRQLIVRSDDTLGRLFLNILWSKLIEMKKHSAKDLTFVCQLNPGMAEVKEGEFVVILFRFDSEIDRNNAYEKLEKERA